MKVLVIGYVWPEPQSSAAGSRMLQLLQCFLQWGWQVTFASAAQQTDFSVDLTHLGIDTRNIQPNDSTFDTFVQDLAPQCVLFDRFMIEEQFGWRVERYAPEALRVLNTEDLHSLREARQRACQLQRPFELQDMVSDLGVREVAAIFRSDLTLMISSWETHLLSTHFHVPASQLLCIPFMLHVPETLRFDGLPSFEQRQHFLMIGNYRHAPNWDAVVWTYQDIWPKIRRALPQAQLHVYGAYQPAKASQLHTPKQGFNVLGRANDAQAVMRQARLLLAPLRFGAGLKGKLLDAMQAGTPSVTTSIGREAMADDLPWCGRVADTAQDLAEVAVQLYADKSRWMDAQDSARLILQQGYRHEVLSQQLKQQLDSLLNTLQEHRKSLFFNAMLRHHTLKSKEYMSRWIEVKNQYNASR